MGGAGGSLAALMKAHTSHDTHQKYAAGHQTTPAWPPRGFSGWLIRRALPPNTQPGQPGVRARIGLVQGVVSVAVNLVLMAIKAALGWVLGSVALLADAMHSLSDIGSSVVIVIGFFWARKPRDSQHPYGHGRIELVTALVVAVLLIVIALEFVRVGIGRIIHPQPVHAAWWMLWILAGTIFLKQWVALFCRRLAKATDSTALAADYWHHVADALSTWLVLLALLTARLGWAGADGWAGLVIAGFIFYTGIQTARAAISPLLGEAPSPADVARIQQAALDIPGVRNAHDLMLHTYGEDRVISLHIEVDAGLTALQVHDLSEQVEDRVEQTLGGKAIVHVDPVDRSHPQYERAEDVLQSVVADHDQLTEFHDLRLEGPPHRLTLSVDVVAIAGTREADYPAIAERVKQAIAKALPDDAHVSVTVETPYHMPGLPPTGKSAGQSIDTRGTK